jgi:hypothetical protein
MALLNMHQLWAFGSVTSLCKVGGLHRCGKSKAVVHGGIFTCKGIT